MISIDLKIDFLPPISNGVVTAKRRSIKIGKSMCLAEATETDKDGKWLAHGTSKMMVTKELQIIKDEFRLTGSALPPKFL
jgi:acyl-coenzyme A thioesterase PaaI-like protein